MNYFPNELFDEAGAYAEGYFTRLAAAARAADHEAVSRAGALLLQTVQAGGRTMPAVTADRPPSPTTCATIA